MKLYLGAEMLDAELALTLRQIQTGMMFRTNIQDTDAMLFNLRVPQPANFWMKNCPESISAAYITADGVIQEIHHLEKNDTNGVVAARNDIIFVLETSDGWFDRHHVGVGTVIQSEKGPLAQVFLAIGNGLVVADLIIRVNACMGSDRKAATPGPGRPARPPQARSQPPSQR